MDHNDPLLQQLKNMLRWKKSKAFYAEALNISEEQVDYLLEQIKKSPPPDVSNYSTSISENVKTGEGEITIEVSEEIKSLDDLIRVAKIDTKKWDIEKYIQNYWGNVKDPKWQVKVTLSPKTKPREFQENFITFLESYTPSQPYIAPSLNDNPNACLVINKQDQHHNKYDIFGDNNMQERFNKVEQCVKQTLLEATLCNNVQKVIYIIGSDEFNSEWNSMTTKGTPQTNLTTHHDSFAQVCEHEIRIINELLLFSETVDIVYIPGNHDEFVGWHLVHYLKCYYRDQPNLNFDIQPFYTKAVLYSNTIMVFNHGDDQKLEKLAQSLPFKYKEMWSQADHYYIFTGDKHHLLAKDIASIECYQIPSLSKAKSSWDSKKGHDVTKSQMFSFLIVEGNGMGNIIKKLI